MGDMESEISLAEKGPWPMEIHSDFLEERVPGPEFDQLRRPESGGLPEQRRSPPVESREQGPEPSPLEDHDVSEDQMEMDEPTMFSTRRKSDRNEESAEKLRPHPERPDSTAAAPSSWSSFRELLIQITTSFAFTWFIYLCIAYDTVTMGVNDFYVQRDTSSPINGVLQISDWIVLAIFTVELLLRLVAQGPGGCTNPQDTAASDEDSTANPRENDSFWNVEEEAAEDDAERDEKEAHQGYFASRWNRFDFFVVVMTWGLIPLRFVQSNADVSRVARILRIFRPLRAFRTFDGTQDVLMTFPRAIPAIGDVLSLLLFVFIVYAILGLNIFGLDGQWHGRCVVDEGWATETHGLLLKGNLDGSDALCGDGYGCPEGFRCSCRPRIFPNGTWETAPYAYQDPVSGDPGCLHQGSARPWSDGGLTERPTCPGFGFDCFDNFANAIYTCFATITLDSWSVYLWWGMDTANETVGLIYFTTLVGIVAFNVVNLNVAVISSAYQEVRARRREINKLKKAKKTLSGKLSWYKRCRRVWQRYLDGGRARNSHPLNPVAMAARRAIVWPLYADECGLIVPSEVIKSAQERNLRVEFGPECGEWRLVRAGTGDVFEKLAPNEDATSGQSNRVTSEDGCDTVQWEDDRELPRGTSQDGHKADLRSTLTRFHRDPNCRTWTRSRLAFSAFDSFIFFCILGNTVIMALEHFNPHPVKVEVPHQPWDHCCNADCSEQSEDRCPRGMLLIAKDWETFLYVCEGASNLIFTVEIVLKLLANWSFQRFTAENYPFNAVDLCIVVTSDAVFIAEFFLPKMFNVALFRLLRIVRTFRVVSRFRRLRLLVHKAAASFKSILHVLFVLIFWHVLGALLGMQILGCSTRKDELCQMRDDGSCPEDCGLLLGDPPQCVFDDDQVFEHCPWDDHSNFNTFYSSIVALFFVTTGENWVSVMVSGMRSNPSIWPGLFFFIIFYTVSFYMLVNLFIGVILEEFELTEEEKEGLQLGFFRVHILKELRRRMLNERKRKNRSQSEVSFRFPPVAEASDAEMVQYDQNIADMEERLGDDALMEGGGEDNEEERIFYCLGPPTPNPQEPDAPMNLRAYATLIANHTWFERLILFTIIVSAVHLALESPVKEFSSIDKTTSSALDYVFFCIFALEFVVKVLEHGVYWEHKHAYFRVSWNCLDFFILLFQVLDIAGFPGLKSLRAMRVVRPLRLLNKIKSLQLLLKSIQASTTDMINVLLLWLFCCIVFSISAINLFGGVLYACNDGDFVGAPLNPGEEVGSDVGWRENCAGNFYTEAADSGESYVDDEMPTGILKPRVWSTPADGASGLGWHFDNFVMAFQSLYEVSTFEQWSDYVYSCVDATSPGQQPVLYSTPSNVIFFCCWVVLSCFFVQQLVIGVLIEAINQKSGTALYTDLQRNWLRMSLRMKSLKPLTPTPTPTHAFRYKVWQFANGSLMTNTITVVILINILLMATESYAQPEWWTETMDILNWIFIAIYIAEFVVKFIAYLHLYFLDPWNIFDLAIVLSSVVESSVGGQGGVGLQALRTLRILKVLRTLRLVRRARRLRLMINALMSSIPPILSSMVFLGLFVFLFAVLGVQFFSGVRHGLGVHRRNNFHTTWNGLQLLVRAITGENWETVMRDCAIQPPMCTSDAEAREILGDENALGDCGNTVAAFLFFDLFFLIGNNILLNLFVAVLLESFNNFQVQNQFVLSENHLESFQEQWRVLDPMGKGKIGIWQLRDLLENLHADRNPLGTCVLANEFKFRSVRVELLQEKHAEGEEMEFERVLLTFGIHVVGVHGLPYPQMLERVEKITYYGQVAAVSKMTALFRALKDRHATADAQKEQQQRRQQDSPLGARGRSRAVARGAQDGTPTIRSVLAAGGGSGSAQQLREGVGTVVAAGRREEDGSDKDEGDEEDEEGLIEEEMLAEINQLIATLQKVSADSRNGKEGGGGREQREEEEEERVLVGGVFGEVDELASRGRR